MKEGYVLVMTSLWLLGGVSSQDCPWEEQGLLPWSDAMTWESFLIPSEGSEVCGFCHRQNAEHQNQSNNLVIKICFCLYIINTVMLLLWGQVAWRCSVVTPSLPEMTSYK